MLSYATISTIVGQRMYPDVLPDEAQMPAIVFYCDYTEREHYLGGLTKYASARFTVACYGATRWACATLSKAIRESGIDNFQGSQSGFGFCGCEFMSSDQYRYDIPTDGNKIFRYIAEFDLTLHYQEN